SLGRQLVRVDEDARRPHSLASQEARRRPRGPQVHPDGARRGLPLRRAGGLGAVSLRARLLLASAYVLLLAIVALGIPLALSLRDRVDTEVRSQARSQADVVAATGAELVGHGRSATLE